MKHFKDRALSYYQRHESQATLVFFCLGILWDILTLGRIDQVFTLVQQCMYMLVIGFILICDVTGMQPDFQKKAWLEKPWQARSLLLHFLFGSLLSGYMLFYLKSASMVSSFVFLGLLAVILLVNELPRFHAQSYRIKFGLFVICFASYWLYVIPILLGYIGWVPFLVSLLLTSLCVLVFIWICCKKASTEPLLKKRLSQSGYGVVAAFFVFYLLHWIPPVPLSLQHIGIYHNVEKSQSEYLLSYSRPFWKFWQNGDQDFDAQTGDKIYCFFRLFSPTRFQDRIQVRWLLKGSDGWATQDVIPVSIVGGRDDGYRGFTYKSSYQPGKWRIQIETTDGREIGRISFDVEMQVDASAPREFRTDIQ